MSPDLNADPGARRAALTRLALVPPGRVALLTDAEVIELLQLTARVGYLARTAPVLLAEMEAAPQRFTRSSLVRAYVLLVLTLLALAAACGLFGGMLT